MTSSLRQNSYERVNLNHQTFQPALWKTNTCLSVSTPIEDLPLGDGSYQRLWGATGERHTGPGTVSNLPRLWGRLEGGSEMKCDERGLAPQVFCPPPRPYRPAWAGV